jgi:hypothetical protein
MRRRQQQRRAHLNNRQREAANELFSSPAQAKAAAASRLTVHLHPSIHLSRLLAILPSRSVIAFLGVLFTFALTRIKGARRRDAIATCRRRDVQFASAHIKTKVRRRAAHPLFAFLRPIFM